MRRRRGAARFLLPAFIKPLLPYMDALNTKLIGSPRFTTADSVAVTMGSRRAEGKRRMA